MKFNFRRFVSLFIAFSLIIMVITGFMMYLLSFSEIVASIHTFFSFSFFIVVIFHIKNNWKSLVSYILTKREIKKSRINKELISVFIFIVVVLMGILWNIHPFNYVYNFGNKIRSQRETKDQSTITYEVIKSDLQTKGASISVEVQKGAKNYWTVMAIWVEDTAGNYIKTLYVTKNIATGTFYKDDGNGNEIRGEVRRPEAVPYWSHKRGIIAEDGLFIPTSKNPIPDGISGATMKSSYILNSKIDTSNLSKFRVLYEVNRSFDWNEYYHEKAFPDDKIYSGNGFVGQPSLIYSTDIIDVQKPEDIYLMKVIGHGHHSGKDGKLYPDISKITTALEITKRVLVEIKK